MTPEEQITFVKSLTKAITEDVVISIEKGRIPESWTGLELRQFLADKFARATVKMARSDKHEYNNTILINNL